MKKLITATVVYTLMLCVVLLAGIRSIEAQRTINNDPYIKGSSPYDDAVKSYLDGSQKKIIGGKPAADGAYPWQVSLGVSWIATPFDAHFCGGSIYSDKWIVTAAHCVVDLNPSQVVITAGTNRLTDGLNRTNVRRIIIHKSYQRANHDNDIALLELLKPLTLGPKVRVVQMLTPENESKMIKDSTKFVVTGWGATTEGGTAVRDLRYLDNLPFLATTTCNRASYYDNQITGNMMCAGDPVKGGIDSCQGDSGGPLTIGTSANPMLAGIVSWGEGCGRPYKVGVYTRAANYAAWVGSCVSGAAGCNQ